MKALETGIGLFFLAIIVGLVVTNPGGVAAAGSAVSTIGSGVLGGFANFAGRA